MTTIIRWSGFEFPDPTANTVPSVMRIIGPVGDGEATFWLAERGFIQGQVNCLASGKRCVSPKKNRR